MAKKDKASKADKEEKKKGSDDGAVTLKEAKQAYTDYLKKNKLSRDKDYSEDKKHGKNIRTLQLAIDKLSDKADDSAKKDKKDKKEKKTSSKKESAGREAKYEYPEGLTAAEKKKFRIEQRKKAKGGEDKPKKEKAGKAKEEKSSKSSKKETTAPKEKETVISKKDKAGKKDKKKKDKKKSKND